MLALPHRPWVPPHFQFKEILRKDVIELVLATDMKQVRG